MLATKVSVTITAASGDTSGAAVRRVALIECGLMMRAIGLPALQRLELRGQAATSARPLAAVRANIGVSTKPRGQRPPFTGVVEPR